MRPFASACSLLLCCFVLFGPVTPANAGLFLAVDLGDNSSYEVRVVDNGASGTTMFNPSGAVVLSNHADADPGVGKVSFTGTVTVSGVSFKISVDIGESNRTAGTTFFHELKMTVNVDKTAGSNTTDHQIAFWLTDTGFTNLNPTTGTFAFTSSGTLVGATSKPTSVHTNAVYDQSNEPFGVPDSPANNVTIIGTSHSTTAAAPGTPFAEGPTTTSVSVVNPFSLSLKSVFHSVQRFGATDNPSSFTANASIQTTAVVPEPSSLVLWSVALGSLVLCGVVLPRRRRRLA